MWVSKLCALQKVRIFGQNRPILLPKNAFSTHIGLAGSFCALLVVWLMVVVRGLYLARQLFNFFTNPEYTTIRNLKFAIYYPLIRPLPWTSGPSCRIEIQSQTDNCWQGMGKWTRSCSLAFRSKQRKRLDLSSYLTSQPPTKTSCSNLNQTCIILGIDYIAFFSLFCMGRLSSWSTMLTKEIKTWSLPIERLIWASFFVNSLNSMLGLLEWPKSWMEKDIRGGALKKQVKERLENKNIRLSD